MLSSSERNKLVDKVNTAFNGIGKANGTKMPQSTNNLDTYAYDLWVAHQLVALANKRKLLAEKQAVLSGVMIDKEKDPRPEGTNDVLFTGDNVSVTLKVSNAANRVDSTVFFNYLADKGVPHELLIAALNEASTKSRPAHVFTTFLLTND